MMRDDYTRLINVLRGLVRLNEPEQELIRQQFEPVAYKKKQVLVEEGNIARYMYFINEGYVRTYYLVDGLEVTNNINCPLGFMTAFTSYMSESPSHETMQCITECRLLKISKERLTTLFKSSPTLAESGRIINEEVALYNENRARDLVSKTAEERYIQLMKNHPDFVLHVPLQYIASFIGVKPESLSRIRKNLGLETF